MVNVMSIPIVYGLYKVLRWAGSKLPTVIALVILWKKRSRLNTFFDNILRRIEHVD